MTQIVSHPDDAPARVSAQSFALTFEAAAFTEPLELNGVPAVRNVVVTASAPLSRPRLRVHLEAADTSCEAWERVLENIRAESSLAVEASDLTIPAAILRRSTEREVVELVATLSDVDGVELASARHRLTIIPASHWCGMGHACESLAAFVTPNAPAVRDLLLDASRRLEARTGNGALDGYLSNSPDRVQRIVEACYEALSARSPTYSVLLASFESAGQKVRALGEVLEDGIGNCLDLSVTLAALLEACHLSPVIVLGDQHAVVGVATIDDHFADPVHEGPSRLVNRLDLGELRIIEATGACGARLSFGEALSTGESFVRKANDTIQVVDIRAARRAGVHPLPERLQEADRAQKQALTREPKDGAWGIRQPVGLPPLPRPKLAPHEVRLEQWMKRLLDLTLRNRLLNDRDAVGIPLAVEGDGSLAALEDELWSERLLKLLPSQGQRGPLSESALREELGKRWLRSTLDPESLFGRATKVFREARLSLEETGARALYVGIGSLEYRVEQRDAPVRAPILLVPVELKRISKSEGFQLFAVAEDTVPNVALVEYLRLTHHLDIGLGGGLPEDDTGLDVAAILARVRHGVKDAPGFTVLSTAKLGIYSFKKLPIFQEMRERRKAIADHVIVRGLLDRNVPAAIRGAHLVTPEEVETEATFASLKLPLPADSSQIGAVLSATRGATFVLQGPPGTGKSQTITNLLCESLSKGLRVLFIAEKSAALLVVSERLQKAGLTSYVLDLHADHATKTSFVAQMKASLEDVDQRASRGSRQFDAVAGEADRNRERLHASCNALHEAHETGPSPYDAIERSVATRPDLADTLLGLDGALPIAPTAKDVAGRLAITGRLANATRAVTSAAREKLFDLNLAQPASSDTARSIAAFSRELLEANARLVESGEALARDLGVAAAPTEARLRGMVAVTELFQIDGPGVSEAISAALSPAHGPMLESLTAALNVAEAGERARAELDDAYDQEVLGLPLSELVGDLRAARERFMLFRWLACRRVRKVLLRTSKRSPAKDVEALLAALAFLIEVKARIPAGEAARSKLSAFQGADGRLDYGLVRALIERIRVTGAAGRHFFAAETPAAAVRIPAALASGSLPRTLEKSTSALGTVGEKRLRLEHVLGGSIPFVREDARLVDINARLTAWVEAERDIPAWTAFTAMRAEASVLGLLPVAEALLSGNLSPDRAEAATECALLSSWVRSKLRSEPALGDCAADQVAKLRRGLLAAVKEYRGGAAGSVVTVIRDRARSALASEDPTMRGALRIVDGLRAVSRINRPIRKVMLEGAPAIVALKPIVLASPLSAATFLSPQFPPFDLVVFDEASQVPVWDAACALSRGKAVVIVGDSKQLPPTNFFDRRDAGDGQEGDAAASGDLEQLDSILEEAIAAGIPQLSLLWHYRSRDERLIEFSNRRSYSGRLQTFPSPLRSHSDLGVEFRHVRGVYDRSKTSTNRAEAEAIVLEIVRRLLHEERSTANRSIGVVTFSQAQQALVQDLLDEAMDGNPKLRARLAEAAEAGESVFVKNLENVQGDERATMLFSICYGRDATGAMHHSFGPINLAGGERRLNVAVSRAREKIIIFSSIRASDLDSAKCRSKGAQDLRDYLSFAELGTIPTSREGSDPQRSLGISPIEQELARRLEARGWRVDLHVGRSRDYRLSLALAHPDRPDRWVVGVELDGGFYRSAPTVIDREVVRDAVMEALGWRIVKISCLDFLWDAEAVVDRVDQFARSRII